MNYHAPQHIGTTHADEGYRTQTPHSTQTFAGVEAARADRAFEGRQRYRLLRAKDTLLRELASETSPRRRATGERGGSGTPVCVTDSRTLAGELEAMLERKLRLRLERVERALEKVAQGTYGTCDVTGERIPRERLERVPEEVETAEGRRRLLATGGRIRGRS
ncbi:MAG TPA: hypothetical protein VHM69_00990 [Rubrobacter sp.]|nr:hypothetical protein [Rubrobacter sp.]